MDDLIAVLQGETRVPLSIGRLHFSYERLSWREDFFLRGEDERILRSK